jgi:hypothetical protein
LEALKDLGQKKQGNRNYRFGLFKCPYCNEVVEKIYKDGLKAKACSHRCYGLNREKRGAYKEKIMVNKYRYIYMPEHPRAIGTKKLYVAEHRIVMENSLGRFLNDDEVVHHKDENTLNNDISNLQLMSAVEHIKHHIIERKRNKDGKFKI